MTIGDLELLLKNYPKCTEICIKTKKKHKTIKSVSFGPKMCNICEYKSNCETFMTKCNSQNILVLNPEG